MTDTIAEPADLGEGFLTGSAVGRRLCRRLILDKLRLKRGGLRLVDRDTVLAELGEPWPEAPLRAVVQVLDDRFWPKVAFGGSIGAAEAYVAGYWRADDLVRALRLFLMNYDVLEELERGTGRLLAPLHRAVQRLRANTRRGSRRNIQAHYDLSNDFFELFLDRELMYSAAIWPAAGSADGDPDAEMDDRALDRASWRKRERLCRKLALGPDDHLLEIGTGWGGFAIHAARRFGCRVTTTTISRAQHEAAVERVRAEGLEDRITVLLSDYRDLEGRFDKLVSIEMIEAVGHRFLDGYFERCAALLRPHGRMALQVITIADRLYPQAKRSVDFIQRHIFPGSHLPSVGALAASIARTDLQIVHLEDIGPHYALTLRAWRRRVLDRREAVRALGFSESFVRLWEYYLAYCEAGFLERTVGDAQIVLTKPSDRGASLLGGLDDRPAEEPAP